VLKSAAKCFPGPRDARHEARLEKQTLVTACKRPCSVLRSR
jgi:hypothetical protein